MSAKKGGGTLDVQRERLKAKLNDEQLQKAQRLVEKEPDVIRYAFKCLPKAHAGSGLSKTEARIYEELKTEQGQAVADKFKASRLQKKKHQSA